MKKILILGLIFVAAGCSNEPQLNKKSQLDEKPQLDADEINQAVALEMLKGSYKTIELTGFISKVDITIGTDVTIDTLNFSITATDVADNLSFEYLDIKGKWVVYKVTFNSETKYTALGAGKSRDGTESFMLIESSTFRDSPDAVTFPEQGITFLDKP